MQSQLFEKWNPLVRSVAGRFGKVLSRYGWDADDAQQQRDGDDRAAGGRGDDDQPAEHGDGGADGGGDGDICEPGHVNGGERDGDGGDRHEWRLGDGDELHIHDAGGGADGDENDHVHGAGEQRDGDIDDHDDDGGPEFG